MSDKTVLFVDDEANVLSSLKRLLRREPYHVLTAEGGAAGLALLAQETVHLVVSDQRMPDMEGTAFLSKVKEGWPHTVRIILSGYADVSVIVEAINKGEVYRFLGKPWNDDELRASIRQCLGQYDLLEQNRTLLARTQEQNLLLEEMVAGRTRSLELSQEVVERLPVPILGVSCEREVVLANQAAREGLESLRGFLPGMSLDEASPAAVAAEVDAVLQGRPRSAASEIAWDGASARLWIRTLGSAPDLRGCVVLVMRTLGRAAFTPAAGGAALG